MRVFLWCVFGFCLGLDIGYTTIYSAGVPRLDHGPRLGLLVGAARRETRGWNSKMNAIVVSASVAMAWRQHAENRRRPHR
jgi:hypothetical protein